jgi:adenosylcobinamide-phosphate synthase
MTAALAGLGFAFLLDAFWGDPPNQIHPVAAMGTFIRYLSVRWNSGSESHQFWMGCLLIFTGSLLFSLPLVLFQFLIPVLPVWTQALLIGFLLKPVFAYRNLLAACRQVETALGAGDITEARRLTAWHLVSRDTSQLEEGFVASAVIESLAENLTDSFFAPLFFFAIGGLPLAWVYRFVNTADAMIAYRNKEFEFFGKFTAYLDDGLNWLPARFAGWFLVLAAVICRFDFQNAYKTMIDQNRRTASPNAGWTIAAAAGALRVTLEKTGQYRLSGGISLPEKQSISQATRLVRIAVWISLAFCGGLLYAIQIVL